MALSAAGGKNQECYRVSMRFLWFIIFAIFFVGVVLFGGTGIPAKRVDVNRKVDISSLR